MPRRCRPRRRHGQRHPDALRGRVLGAQNAVLLGAPALTVVPPGLVAAAAGLPAAIAVVAVLAGVTAVVALLVPAFRSLDVAAGTPRGTPRPYRGRRPPTVARSRS